MATDKSKLAAGAARLVKLIAELEEKYPRVSERRFRLLRHCGRKCGWRGPPARRL